MIILVSDILYSGIQVGVLDTGINWQTVVLVTLGAGKAVTIQEARNYSKYLK